MTLESWEQGWLAHLVSQHSFGGNELLDVSKVVFHFFFVSLWF